MAKAKSSPKEFNNYIASLFSVLINLDRSQLRLLYGDLLTESESLMLAKRLEISRRLLAGQSYLTIQASLGVTANTISQIQKVLKQGGRGFRSANKFLTIIGKSAPVSSAIQVQGNEVLPPAVDFQVGGSPIRGILNKLFHSP